MNGPAEGWDDKFRTRLVYRLRMPQRPEISVGAAVSSLSSYPSIRNLHCDDFCRLRRMEHLIPSFLSPFPIPFTSPTVAASPQHILTRVFHVPRQVLVIVPTEHRFVRTEGQGGCQRNRETFPNFYWKDEDGPGVSLDKILEPEATVGGNEEDVSSRWLSSRRFRFEREREM